MMPTLKSTCWFNSTNNSLNETNTSGQTNVCNYSVTDCSVVESQISANRRAAPCVDQQTNVTLLIGNFISKSHDTLVKMLISPHEMHAQSHLRHSDVKLDSSVSIQHMVSFSWTISFFFPPLIMSSGNIV